MPRYSEVVRMPDGSMAILCFSGRRPVRHACGCGRQATIQCDYPRPEGGTCDAWLCRGCAVHVGRNRDYCPAHQPGLPGLR